MKLSDQQQRALQLLEVSGGKLDDQLDRYAFSVPGAVRQDRIQMSAAKSLVSLGVVEATRVKESRGREMIDQIALVAPEAGV